jgi:predicted DNA-binding transcriptional regulator AlpA
MWDVYDVAYFLKKSTGWVYRQFARRSLPGLKLPGSGTLRFDPAEIRAYVRGEWPPKAA